MIGSFIPPELSGDCVESAKLLSAQGIMKKHKLTRREFEKMRMELYDERLSDILFLSDPDGPRYDITLYLVATSR